jgi:hypothetical protein
VARSGLADVEALSRHVFLTVEHGGSILVQNSQPSPVLLGTVVCGTINMRAWRLDTPPVLPAKFQAVHLYQLRRPLKRAMAVLPDNAITLSNFVRSANVSVFPPSNIAAR